MQNLLTNTTKTWRNVMFLFIKLKNLFKSASFRISPRSPIEQHKLHVLILHFCLSHIIHLPLTHYKHLNSKFFAATLSRNDPYFRSQSIWLKKAYKKSLRKQTLKFRQQNKMTNPNDQWSCSIES